MSPQQAVFNGVPAWLLADYLVDLGGRAEDSVIQGDGWTATVTSPPRPAGSLGLGRVEVEIEGARAAEVMAALRVKARRGGG